jgi:hypothetical protein
MKEQNKSIYYILNKEGRYSIFKTDDAFVTTKGSVIIDNCIVKDTFLLGYDAFYTEHEAKEKLEIIIKEEMTNAVDKFLHHLNFEDLGEIALDESLKRFGYFEVNPLYAVLAYLIKNHNIIKN